MLSGKVHVFANPRKVCLSKVGLAERPHWHSLAKWEAWVGKGGCVQGHGKGTAFGVALVGLVGAVDLHRPRLCGRSNVGKALALVVVPLCLEGHIANLLKAVVEGALLFLILDHALKGVVVLCCKVFPYHFKGAVGAYANAIHQAHALFGGGRKVGMAAVVDPLYCRAVGPLLDKVRHEVGGVHWNGRPRLSPLHGQVGIIVLARLFREFVLRVAARVLRAQLQLVGVPAVVCLALLRLFLKLLLFCAVGVVDKFALSANFVDAEAVDICLRACKGLALFLVGQSLFKAVDQGRAAVKFVLRRCPARLRQVKRVVNVLLQPFRMKGKGLADEFCEPTGALVDPLPSWKTAQFSRIVLWKLFFGHLTEAATVVVGRLERFVEDSANAGFAEP